MSGRRNTIDSLLLRAGLALFGLALGAAPAAATVIYRETFSNNTGLQPDLVSTTGWNVHRNNGGAVAYDPPNNGPHLTNVLGDTSTGANVAVNSKQIYNEPSGANVGFGWAFRNPAPDSPKTDYLFWTSEYTVDRSHYTLDSFTFQSRNTTLSDNMRVAVQIDGNWYASTTAFQSVSSSTFGLHTLNFNSATWRPLTFVANSSLSLPGSFTPAALPDGNITAFGIYFDQLNAQARLDTITINATLPSVTTLAQYTFTQNNPANPPTLTPTTTAANVTVSNLSAGSGVALTTSNGNVPPPSPSGSVILQNLNSTTLSNAISGNDYIQFSVAATPNYELSIEALTFDFQRDSTSQVTSWALYLYNGSTLQLLHDSVVTGIPGSPLAENYFSNSALNLWQIPELQGAKGTLYFRLYFYGVNSPGGNLARIDNLTLLGNSTAIVPEPATAGLLLLTALLGGAPLWRKRRAGAVKLGGDAV